MERSGMKNLKEHEGMFFRFFVDRRWRSPQNDKEENNGELLRMTREGKYCHSEWNEVE